MQDSMSRRRALALAAAAMASLPSPARATQATPDTAPEAVQLLRQFVERVTIAGDLTAIAALADPEIPPQNPADIAGAEALAQRWRYWLARRAWGTWQERITGAYGGGEIAVVTTEWRDASDAVLFRMGGALYACVARDGLIRQMWWYWETWQD